jgi:hypothetical protein
MCVCVCVCVAACCCGCSQYDTPTKQLCDWFPYVRWEGAGFQLGHSCLQAMLPVLQAIRFASDSAEQGATLNLRGLPMSAEVIAMLQQLPAWHGTLVLSDGRWRLPASDYRQLAQHSPVSFCEWRLDMKPDTELFQCICEGLAQHRTKLGLTPIEVTTYTEQPDRAKRRVFRR